jgi:hypothetical protein
MQRGTGRRVVAIIATIALLATGLAPVPPFAANASACEAAATCCCGHGPAERACPCGRGPAPAAEGCQCRPNPNPPAPPPPEPKLRVRTQADFVWLAPQSRAATDSPSTGRRLGYTRVRDRTKGASLQALYCTWLT